MFALHVGGAGRVDLVAVGAALRRRRRVHAHMAVGVDQAGRDDLALGVDDDPAAGDNASAFANGGDDAVFDAHVAGGVGVASGGHHLVGADQRRIVRQWREGLLRHRGLPRDRQRLRRRSLVRFRCRRWWSWYSRRCRRRRGRCTASERSSEGYDEETHAHGFTRALEHRQLCLALLRFRRLAVGRCVCFCRWSRRRCGRAFTQ